MKLYTILVCAFVVCSLELENAEAGYKALNSYLIDKVDDRKVESNMKAAIQWLQELEGTKPKLFSSGLMKDLKKFTALQQVVEDTKCDQTAFEIMRDNESEKIPRSVRRVDLVLHRIFRDHAKKCLEIYPTVFETKKEQFGDTFKYVKTIGDLVMRADEKVQEESGQLDIGDSFYNLDNIFYVYDDNYSIVGYDYRDIRYDYSEYLNAALKINAKGNSDAKFLNKQADEKSGKVFVAKDKVKKLAEEHLVKPCKDYVSMFGTDLFVPARFDVKYYGVKQADKSQFYYGLVYLTICESLIDNQSVVINDIIRLIGKI